MSTKRAFKIAVLLLTVTTVVTVGCGTRAEKNPVGSPPTSSNDPIKPTTSTQPTNPQTPSTPTAQSHPVFGSYDGTLTKRIDDDSTVTAAGTATLSQGSGTSIYLVFDSQPASQSGSGELGAIHFESLVSLGLNNEYPYPGIYTFSSSVLNLPTLSDLPSNATFQVAFNGTQFDPTRSLIYFKSCVYPQGAVCDTMIDDVSFSGLRKR